MELLFEALTAGAGFLMIVGLLMVVGYSLYELLEG